MINGGRIVTFIGQSGSGKTTQMRELGAEEGFRQSPNTTTRSRRESDLPKEYNYLSADEYLRLLKIPRRFLWSIIAGNGANYAKDICDIIDAFTDPDHVYINALTPDTAHTLVRKYGTDLVSTILLPTPSEDVLVERMIERGDTINAATERIARERQEDWLAEAISIEGLYIVRENGVAQRNQEILDFVIG